MSEREGPSRPGVAHSGHASEVSDRIRSILADAEGAADALRHQAEQDAQARRAAAETDALKIIEDARREAERFLTDRIHRISLLSDQILDRGQSVVERLDEADTVRSELAAMVKSLGETAARLAIEMRSMPGPQAPGLDPPPSPRPPEPDTPAVAEEPPPAEHRLGDADSRAPDTTPAQASGSEPTQLRPEPLPPEPAEPEAAVERGPAVDGTSDGPGLVELRSSEEPEEVERDLPGTDRVLGARLVALQMAVAGGNRGEVDTHLRRAFDFEDPGEILDDIFGSGTTPDKRVAWPEAG